MRSKVSKIATTVLLVLCMAISMFATSVFAADTETSSKIDACENIMQEYSAEQASKYVAGDNTYPEKDGYLFAGWYTTNEIPENDQEAVKFMIEDTVPDGAEKVYALFVPEHVLSIKAQVSKHLIDNSVGKDDETAAIRFVTTVDSLLYKQVGFEVSYVNADGELKSATSASNKVYKQLYEADSEDVWAVTPAEIFCGVSTYFKACTVKNVPASSYETEFTVKPFWVTMSGDKVYGETATKAIEDGCIRKEVWVSPDGTDGVAYGSYGYPYETLDYALTYVKDGGTVRVKDDLTIVAGTTWNAHDKKVTITGDDKDEVVEKLIYTADAGFDICINDGVTFTDIEWTLPTGFTIRMFAQGHKLVIKDDVTFTNEEATVQLFGGSNSSAVESTHLEVYAGTYSAIFGGSDTKDVLGDTNVIVGGKVNSGITATEHSKSHILFGAGWKGTVYGDTNIEVQSGAKFNYIFGGGDNAAAVVKGSTNINFAGEAMSIYGGSASGVNADTHVIMTDGYVEQIFGGSESNSMTGNTDVQILGGIVARRIYGGCYNGYSSSGWADTTNAVIGYTSVTFGPDVDGKYATLKTDYKDDGIASDWLGMDDATYYAVSRLGSNYSGDAGKELGVFIINDYNSDANPNKNMAGETDFMSSMASSVKPYHYLVNATVGGEVYSAGNCIYIKPDSGNKATVTVDGTVTYYAECNGYYPLPASASSDIIVTFDTTEATDFIASAEAKIATGEGYAYYETLEQAIAAAEKMENATIENLSTTKKLASIVIKDSANGTVTADKKNCLAGETVTLSGVGNDGYYCAGMKVNGEEVAINTDGTYYFTTEEQSYTVEGIFAEKVFVDNANWKLFRQNEGVVSLPNGGNGGMLQFIKQYTDMDLTITAKNYADEEAANPRTDVLMVFENGTALSLGIATNDSGTIVQTMNHSDYTKIYGNWSEWGTMNEKELAQYADTGVDLRLIRVGTEIYIYLGDRYLSTADLTNGNSGVTADTKMTVYLRHYDDSGLQVDVPFEITTELNMVPVVVADDIENGSVTCRNYYLEGETVTLTVAGAENYFYDSLIVDGEDVIADINGNHIFTASKSYHTVEASFAEGIFVTHDKYNVLSQNVGVLRVPSANALSGGTIQTKDSYNEITAMVRVLADETEIFRFNERFDFENGKYTAFRISNDNTDKQWRVQSAGCNVFGWGKSYNLTDAQIEKLQSEEGIEFKLVRRGLILKVFLDGVDIFPNEELNLTSKDSGITEEMSAKAGIHLYGNSGYDTEIPFTVSKVPTSKITIADDIVNGSVTADKETYVIGDKVTLTVAGTEGYYYDSLTVDGEEVIADINGNYTFTATELEHTVEASFAPPIFKTNTNYNVLSQNVGVIRVAADKTLNMGWLEANDSYDEISVTVKYPKDATTSQLLWERFVINGVDFRFALTNDNKVDGQPVWRVTTAGGKLGWNHADYNYDLTEEQINALTGDSGIVFKMARYGTNLEVYLGDSYLYSVDLTNYGITSEMSAKTYLQFQKLEDKVAEFNVSFAKNSIISIADNIANGSVTTDKERYVIGDEVILTVAGEDGYYYDSLKVDGVDVIADINGQYKFTATQSEHTVEASFATPIFKTNTNYNVLSQNVGVIRVAADKTTGMGWLETNDSYDEMSVTVKYPQDATTSQLLWERFVINGVDFRFVLTNDNKVDGQPVWRVTTGGGKLGWNHADYNYDLTEEQINALTGDSGIVFKMARYGTNLEVYLGDSYLYSVDLTNYGITSEMSAATSLQFQKLEDKVAEFNVSFAKNSTISIADNIANGSVTADKERYVTGDEVILTVAGAEGYYYNSLTVDGEEVIADINGNYTFTATKTTHTVNASFAEPIFVTNDKYDVLSQNVGVLRVPSANALSAGSIQTIDYYNEITATVKVQADDTEIFRFNERFDFENGKYTAFRISNDNTDKQWRVQSVGCNVFGWGKSYNLTDAQIAKLKSEEGIEFKLVRNGLILKVYLDGVDVFPNEELNLTNKSSGITEEMSAKATIYFYGNSGYDTEIPFEVSKDLTSTIIIADNIENGSVTADKQKCAIGEEVTLTVAGAEGYYYDSLTVDGEEVIADANGKYTFTTTKSYYKVEASFAEPIFAANDKYNVLSQNAGVLRVPSANALSAGSIQTNDSYNEITATVKVQADDTEIFRFYERFDFENGKHTAFRITNDNTDNQWRVQSAGCNVFGWGKSYNLTDEQIAKMKSEEGIEFKLVRSGLILKVYLDGVDVFPNEELNLTNKSSGITEGMSAKATLNFYGNNGYDTEIPFEVSKELTSTIIIADDIENGSVMVDKQECAIGEEVTLTVAGAEGYYYDSLTVDGEEVIADANGNYTFTTTKTYHKVEANFAAPIFETNAEYNVLSQNVGVLRVPANNDGDTDYIRTKDSYDEITATVKVSTGETTEFSFWEEFGFSNGKYVRFRISNTTNSTWQVESGGALFGWGNAYKSTLTAEEIAKIQSEGVEFKMVRSGTIVKVYVDGRDMFPNTTLDLTVSSSGITADTTAKVGIRFMGNVGYDTDIKFQLGSTSRTFVRSNQAWDLSRQLAGIVSLPANHSGSSGFLYLSDKYKDINLALNVRDYIGDSTNSTLRQVAWFAFNNGKTASFSVTYTGPADKPNEWAYKVQSMNDSTFG